VLFVEDGVKRQPRRIIRVACRTGRIEGRKQEKLKSTQDTGRRALVNIVMCFRVELKARNLLSDYQLLKKRLCSVHVVNSCLVYSCTENY
jgi:hypothetical protein